MSPSLIHDNCSLGYSRRGMRTHERLSFWRTGTQFPTSRKVTTLPPDTTWMFFRDFVKQWNLENGESKRTGVEEATMIIIEVNEMLFSGRKCGCLTARTPLTLEPLRFKAATLSPRPFRYFNPPITNNSRPVLDSRLEKYPWKAVSQRQYYLLLEIGRRVQKSTSMSLQAFVATNLQLDADQSIPFTKSDRRASQSISNSKSELQDRKQN